MDNEIKVIIYSRTAIKDKLEINKQEEGLQKYCKQKGYKIIKSYMDNGYSANNKARPKYNLMLKDLKQNKFNKIVTLKPDRITRNISEFSKLNKMLEKYDCSFDFVLGNFDTTINKEITESMINAIKEIKRKRKTNNHNI